MRRISSTRPNASVHYLKHRLHDCIRSFSLFFSVDVFSFSYLMVFLPNWKCTTYKESMPHSQRAWAERVAVMSVFVEQECRHSIAEGFEQELPRHLLFQRLFRFRPRYTLNVTHTDRRVMSNAMQARQRLSTGDLWTCPREHSGGRCQVAGIAVTVVYERPVESYTQLPHCCDIGGESRNFDNFRFRDGRESSSSWTLSLHS